jgi:hypothetical protein
MLSCGAIFNVAFSINLQRQTTTKTEVPKRILMLFNGNLYYFVGAFLVENIQAHLMQ